MPLLRCNSKMHFGKASNCTVQDSCPATGSLWSGWSIPGLLIVPARAGTTTCVATILSICVICCGPSFAGSHRDEDHINNPILPRHSKRTILASWDDKEKGELLLML